MNDEALGAQAATTAETEREVTKEKLLMMPQKKEYRTQRTPIEEKEQDSKKSDYFSSDVTFPSEGIKNRINKISPLLTETKRNSS